MTSMSPPNKAIGMAEPSSAGGSVSPTAVAAPKNVAFELMFSDSNQYRARLPMRVQIYPHDTTDSIVTTVKNFYGLYTSPTGSRGVSFEDEHGNTLIARYENLRSNMVVYVRVIEDSAAPITSHLPHPYQSGAVEPEPYHRGEGYQGMAGARAPYDIARPDSRTSRRRSPSPSGGRRSASTSTNGKKSHSRSLKSHTAIGPYQADAESLNGYSSGDGAPGSSSSRNMGITDISVENIVEGGRRKRAKFESSELPLFAPPQMPAATSNASVSPARRFDPHRPSLPGVQPGQNPFVNARLMPSPQAYQNGINQPNVYAQSSIGGRRSSGTAPYMNNGSGPNGVGILPTPDPTVGSCMSEEDKDVALQLMRLGDLSNISHGRTSASTLDETFSGRADAASSTGATSDGDSDSADDLPAARRQKVDAAGTARPIYQSTEPHTIPASDGVEYAANGSAYDPSQWVDHKLPAAKDKAPNKNKGNLALSKPTTSKSSKASSKSKKLPPIPTGPMSPASMPPSRKQSVASNGNTLQPADEDHPDLSTKPRCQRCRKSKKGCDRQRPCGRCRDAGLTADQCISEDEGNGRKGRYGRHMGVPIKKDDVTQGIHPALLPPAPITTAAAVASDKNKKRKR